MILVDTSVWVDHFRTGNQRLRGLLDEDQVLTHPFVIGELACGSMRNRAEVLALLEALPSADLAEHREVLEFVERERLYRRGVGWVDAHLLASARLAHAALWTLDRPLLKIASALAIAVNDSRE
jgi:predicted nucleic acid-binding protein